MSFVDKRRLAEALKLNGKKPSVFEFAWAECLDEPILSSISLSEVGDIPVPISLTDIEHLAKACSLAPNCYYGVNSTIEYPTNQTLQIDASRLVSFDPASFLQNGVSSVASMAVCHLGINPGVVSFEAHLDKLTLFPPGGYMKACCNMEKEPGMFGSLFLHIPVMNGHTGGKLKITFDKKSKLFDCETDSNSKFYLTAMHNGCEQESEPIINGWMVILSINLVWRNAMAMADSPLPLPTLITALNEMAEALRAWNSPTTYEALGPPISKDISPEEIIASVLDPSQQSDRLDYSPVLKKSPRPSSEKSNMLFFLLEGKYNIADLGFADLTDQDQLLARLLSCSQFLDVHLAVITQEVSSVLDYCDLEEENNNGRFKIEHWINSTNTLIKLKGIEFDLRTQVIGNLKKFRNYSIQEDGDKENAMQLLCNTRSFSCHHPVLVIWPKPQTIRIYCQYGFNAVLDRMEAAVDISSNHRQELIGDLGIVLSFCRAEPIKVWRDPTVEPGQRTYRLLRLCLFLRARDEGLELLELLGTDFPLDRVDSQQDRTQAQKPFNCFYEGIRSSRVALAIAEFQSLISGWNACCHRIMSLVTPTRIVEQLANCIYLVKQLITRTSFEGATELMDCVSFTLANLDAKLATNLKQSELDAFVEQMIIMESDSRTSNQHRLACLATLFPRLDFYQQCRLVVDLKKESCRRLQKVSTCQETFRDLCRALSFSDIHAAGPVASVVVELLKCYLDLNDEYLVQSLTEKICTLRSSTSEPSFPNDNQLLETILQSAEIWELVSMSQLGKTTLANLVIARVSHVVSMMDMPVVVRTNEVIQRCESARPSLIMQPPQENMRTTLSTCVRQVFNLERKNALNRQQGTKILSSLYSKLSLEQLCHLVLDLRVLEGSILKENSSTSSLFVELCQLLVDKSKESMPQVPHEVIIKVVKSFIWLGDVMLVRSLVKQICLAGSGGSWDPADKNKLLETILSSPDSWGELAPGSSRLVRDSSTALIGAWIVGLCRILDQVSSNATLERTTDGLRSKIAKCVDIFIRTEKSQPRSDQPSIATFFTLLLSKLSLEKLCHLIVDLHKIDAAEPSGSILKISPCSKIYRDMCRLLVSKDVSSVIKSFGFLVTEVWKCLLWFGDEDIFKTLSAKILEAFLPSQENPVVAKIVASTELRQLVRTSSHGRAAFSLFLDQRINRLKAMTKPFLSWDYPYAVVPGHPEVETFLRSSHKSLMYNHFSTFAAACKFAIQLSGTKDGYSIHVNPEKVGKHFQCKIEKLLSRNALLNNERNELEDFLVNLREFECTDSRPNQLQLMASSNVPIVSLKREMVDEEDEIRVVQPTKRSKEEPTILDSVLD